MRVLVTGGAGYIGSHTAQLLARRGHDVVVLDTLERGSPAAVRDAALVVGSVADREVLDRLFDGSPVDAVVHFAAWKAAEESLRDPGRYFGNNVAGTLTLLDAMVAANVRALVYSSSCAVYGTPEHLPVTEAAATRPENAYGESKLLVERLLPWYERAHGLRSAALRYFNAAGAEPDGSNGEDWRDAANLVPVVMKAAAGLIPAVPVYGTDYPTSDGTAVRDYVHVLDLAEAHARALDHLASGGTSCTVNVGTGLGSSVRELIATAERVVGRSIAVSMRPRRDGDPAAVWADASRARAMLGWNARFDLEEIVRSAWAWHSLHPFGHESGDRRAVPNLAPSALAAPR